MCGIVGALDAKENIVPLLIKGLERLEYRGYDSAGVAVWNQKGHIDCVKQAGKVSLLKEAIATQALTGTIGIAHTRWATHGKPSQANAHPHQSGDTIALVHNGIIENAQSLKALLVQKGYNFNSDTDTEVIAHLLHDAYAKSNDFTQALLTTCNQLTGSYALLILHHDEPDVLYGVSHKSPLMVGVDQKNRCYFASDALALSGLAEKGFYLQSGQVARAKVGDISLFDASQKPLEPGYQTITLSETDVSMAGHDHFMHKEIHEQPQVIRQILGHYFTDAYTPITNIDGIDPTLLKRVKRVHVVGCGTSFYSGRIAKYWFEEHLGLPVTVTLGSEFHYHRMAIEDDTLLIALSQSGETADTLESIRSPQSKKYIARLAMCNVAQSSMVKDCDLYMPLLAGPEIGVASTKAFTAQITTLFTLGLAIAKLQGKQSDQELNTLQHALFELPSLVEHILELENEIKTLAHKLLDSDKVLFLGRNLGHPTALEGALKLKEISYIHAHAYPAGELKHGPLALIDDRLYIVALLPNDHLVDKTISNLQEVQARAGRLILFHQGQEDLKAQFPDAVMLKLPKIDPALSPFPFTIALQLLAYHVACIKGLDVDKPRNLAKSVTVE